ncbi:MAG: hypothetical protein WDO24_01350 [Pseudomonadota bacterium]
MSGATVKERHGGAQGSRGRDGRPDRRRIAAIIYGLATRLEPARGTGAASGQAGAPIGGRIELPAGGKIVDMTASGDRLVLRVALPDMTERLLVVDLAHGRQVGALELVRP